MAMNGRSISTATATAGTTWQRDSISRIQMPTRAGVTRSLLHRRADKAGEQACLQGDCAASRHGVDQLLAHDPDHHVGAQRDEDADRQGPERLEG